MRHSPLRHPLAILRQITGLGQRGLGDLVGRSFRTIQSIELGRHDLSEDLAYRISHETGVSYAWLVDADPKVEPWVNGPGKVPYRKEHFEITRALLSVGNEPTFMDLVSEEEAKSVMSERAWNLYTASWVENVPFWSLDLPTHIRQVLASVEAASRVGRSELALHRIQEFANKLKTEFGQSFTAGFLDRYLALLEECRSGIEGVGKLVREGGPIFWSPFVANEKWEKGGSVLADVYLDPEQLHKWGVTQEQLQGVMPKLLSVGLDEIKKDFFLEPTNSTDTGNHEENAQTNAKAASKTEEGHG